MTKTKSEKYTTGLDFLSDPGDAMRKLLVLLIVATLFTTPVNADNEYKNESKTVYITATGEYYHKEKCQHLHSSKIEITLLDAVNRGYRDCSVCNPPELITRAESRSKFVGYIFAGGVVLFINFGFPYIVDKQKI